ncbi:MAG: GWxTD domain-containing protein [Bacteroidota bacterium]|nr:GWxTD domain-containing protein [Bacteroidota bacterium]MDP4232780.1 GWxTD domain-containing protein [Bacteroidota bacterium]MDP4242538.1 GWxTD domain-containing protein [Bacteroidota bacterium]MDP4288883.1 GWxTD domain-containing protein [Bacteroidota bacterium]
MISTRSILFALATLSVLITATRAQQGPVEADAVAFRYDSTRCEVEIFYGVLERALAFHQSGNNWTALVRARTEIWQNGALIANKDINDTLRHTGTKAQVDSLGANKLLGAAGFTIPYAPTTNAAFLWQRGAKDGKPIYDTILIPLSLPSRENSHFALGGIEMASSAKKSLGKTSPFEKAGEILTPNPSAVFGENYTKLYYYTEVYVPRPLIDPSQSMEVVSSVVDGTGREVLTGSVKLSIAGETLPVVGALDIDGLAGDSYKLRIRIRHEDAVVAEIEKPFYFVSEMKLSEEAPSQSAVDESILFAASDFSKLSESEADERIAQSLYMGSETDHSNVKSLKDVEAKRHFLYDFWRKQDAAHNAVKPLGAYHDFMSRVDSANKLYTHMKTAGWKSGRGRVFIIYGLPSALDDTHMVGTESKPYIVWEYDPTPNMRLTAGSTRPMFVFVDRQGGGNFVLVHSTVVGENYEPDWYNREAYRLTH